MGLNYSQATDSTPNPNNDGLERNWDFGRALTALRGGLKVARDGWNGKCMWVALSPGFDLAAERVFSGPVREAIGAGVGNFRPYLIMRTAQGDYVPWVASQTDILANDWEPASA